MILRSTLLASRTVSRSLYAAPAIARPAIPLLSSSRTSRRLAFTSGPELPTGEKVPAQLVSSPSQEDLDREEIDISLSNLRNANLTITDSAAERLRQIAIRDNDPNVALRLTVESGGCHGYQDKVELTSVEPNQSVLGDFVFEHPTRKPSKVVVDAMSLALLKGSTINFATELIGSSFRIENNPQAASDCGCGVSWEAKPDALLPGH